MADSKTHLEQEKFYHIYNHAVGEELLFKSERNYLFFLDLTKRYLNDYVVFYAYCLMPNHFHFIVKVKSEQEIILKENLYEGSNPRRDYMGKSVSLIISQKFSNLFNSYAQAYNKENDRRGSLFVNRYKRILISDKKYLLKLIHYIHYNPVMANLC